MIHVVSVQPDILFAWRGLSLLITDPRGECGPEHPLTGYYFRETRFLSTFRLEVTLTICGRLQATAVNAFRDAEPGRIVYQLRHSPAARLDFTPEGLGYADFASSLMFVISLA